MEQRKKKYPNSQSNPTQKEQIQRHHITGLQIILENYNYQNSRYTQKQTHRPMEQNGEPRNKAKNLQPTDLRHTKTQIGERTSYLINGAGKTTQPHVKA